MSNVWPGGQPSNYSFRRPDAYSGINKWHKNVSNPSVCFPLQRFDGLTIGVQMPKRLIRNVISMLNTLQVGTLLALTVVN